MNLEVSPLLRRLLAVALLLALVALAWGVALQPLARSYASYRESAEQSQALLARYRALGASEAERRRELARLQRASGSRTRVLQGASPALAAAQLQNQVKRIVTSSRGTLRSMQILQGRAENGFRQVSIRVILDAPIASLQNILYQLETSGVYLFLDNLQVRSRAGRRQLGRKVPVSDVLNARFDVSGYMRETES